MVSVRQWLSQAVDRLQAISDQAAQEARWLVEVVLEVDGVTLLLGLDRALLVQEVQRLESKLCLREEGVPLAYVLEQWPFYGLNLLVTQDTLIPRPETEFLVDHLLCGYYAAARPLNVLDLGTGTGAIALAIAKERPMAQVLALDASLAALAVAKGNAKRNDLDRVCFMASRWCASLSRTPHFDVIVSNPPYLSDCDPHLLGSIAYEPRSALVAGSSGMEDLATIVQQSFPRLRCNGLLILEHGFAQAAQLRAMLESEGFKQIQTVRDLAGHERVTQAVKTC